MFCSLTIWRRSSGNAFQCFGRSLIRRTLQLIVTFIRHPTFIIVAASSFLIQLVGFREKPLIVPPEIECLNVVERAFSPKLCQSGIRFALSIVLGFLWHTWESLNVGWGGKVQLSHLPWASLFNATHIRLFLGRLLPSRAYVCFTGHFILASIVLLFVC